MGHLKNMLIKENFRIGELVDELDIDNFGRDVIPTNRIIRENVQSEDEQRRASSYRKSTFKGFSSKPEEKKLGGMLMQNLQKVKKERKYESLGIRIKRRNPAILKTEIGYDSPFVEQNASVEISFRRESDCDELKRLSKVIDRIIPTESLI